MLGQKIKIHNYSKSLLIVTGLKIGQQYNQYKHIARIQAKETKLIVIENFDKLYIEKKDK